MLSLADVLEKNIKIPTPKGNISEEEKKQIFATNLGWVKINENGKSEILFIIKNLNLKINDYIKNQKVILDEDKKNNIIDNNDIIDNNNNATSFDYIETEEGIEIKKLKKNNLLRLYLVWTNPINIKANDGLKTYIKVYTNKDKFLGNAYYRERINEKTLLFVYKLGKERIDGSVKVNPLIHDGRIKDEKGNLVLNSNTNILIEGIFANIE